MIRVARLTTLVACVAAAGCDFSVVCTLEARAGIAATVRDSVTGAGLAAGAVALAREHAYVDTLEGINAEMWGAWERGGIYRLEVSHAGYAAWARNGIWVRQGRCHVETVTISVLLVPNP